MRPNSRSLLNSSEHPTRATEGGHRAAFFVSSNRQLNKAGRAPCTPSQTYSATHRGPRADPSWRQLAGTAQRADVRKPRRSRRAQRPADRHRRPADRAPTAKPHKIRQGPRPIGSKPAALRPKIRRPSAATRGLPYRGLGPCFSQIFISNLISVLTIVYLRLKSHTLRTMFHVKHS